MNIGVIGAGLMGTTHIRVISESVLGARVVAVSDALHASAERVADEYGIASVYTDAYGLIGDEAVEAVIIASPAPTHEAFTLACLQTGKPVLCEKPLATSPEACRRVLDAEAALGRRLVQVGFMRRFDPGYVELKARLDAGAVGAPNIVHCAHRNPAVPPSFTSAMIITDSLVHEIDTIRWLLGEEIACVTVFATPEKAGLQDPQLVVFETASGRLVDVECFVNAQYGYDIRCEVVGETGTLALATPPTVASGFQQRFGGAYVHELQAWVAGDAAGADAWDGYAAAAVSEAAVRSLRTRRTVEVELTAERDLVLR